MSHDQTMRVCFLVTESKVSYIFLMSWLKTHSQSSTSVHAYSRPLALSDVMQRSQRTALLWPFCANDVIFVRGYSCWRICFISHFPPAFQLVGWAPIQISRRNADRLPSFSSCQWGSLKPQILRQAHLHLPYALQNCTDDVATVEKGEGDQEQVEGVAQIAASQNHTEDDVSCLKRQSIFCISYETYAYEHSAYAYFRRYLSTFSISLLKCS